MQANALGDVGEMEAAIYFRSQGFFVSKPIGDAPYDLVVDDGGRLFTVEVKTTETKKYDRRPMKNGQPRGPRSWDWHVTPDPSKGFDYLYCNTPDHHFLIPRSVIPTKGRTCINLPKGDYVSKCKWMRYIIHDPPSMEHRVPQAI